MSAKSLVLLAGVGMASAAIPVSESNEEFLFTKWVQQYEKSYEASEFFTRFANFKKNLNTIMEHNASGKSWTMAMNQFGDMTKDEFRAKYTGFRGPANDFMRSMNAPETPANFEAPDSIDWRTKGAVTPVKNQGQCGSCWAFSTTGSTEGMHQIATGKLVGFSEQQLVDCSSAEGNNGCNGGLMDQGFEYIIKQGGLCTESEYPYTASVGECQSSGCKAVENLVGSYKDVTHGDEDALKIAAAQNPVSIAIEADQSSFQFYSGGVMDGECGDRLDHGVLIVGYGTDSSSNKDYWWVKNSWGAAWGESGYIRLVRGQNQCGLANAASYPIAGSGL